MATLQAKGSSHNPEAEVLAAAIAILRGKKLQVNNTINNPPGHTDLMVPPETIGPWLEANPPPPAVGSEIGSETLAGSTAVMRVMEHQAKMCVLAGQTAEAEVLRDAMLIMRGLTLDAIGKLRGDKLQVNNTINNPTQPTVRNTVVGWVEAEPENINKHNGSTD